MPSADYLRLGDWNVRCDRCGRKLKGSQALQTWQGLWVCSKCWEPRHPQDFVRSVTEHPTPPFVRNPPDIFINTPEPLALEGSLWADASFILAETGTFLLSET